ncbi:anti-sigma regulatory factor [bacterium]|nr:anti-sigma regulatory factor [bacterium]MBP9810223.1 anti-sigma regulatory factor [bacterium]
MIVRERARFAINDKSDVVSARKEVVSAALALGMSTMKEAQLRTAVTELLTNMMRYAGGGYLLLEQLEHDHLKGIRVVFEDSGPGIVDVPAALSQGFSTGNSLGHGLSGCKKLVDSFELESSVGKGTKVVITKWC